MQLMLFSRINFNGLNVMPSLQKTKVFFTRKIGQKVPQMAPIQLDQGAILVKSFWTRSFWFSFFGWFLLLKFFILFFTNQQYFDNKNIWLKF
jgi:hypothetical protein